MGTQFFQWPYLISDVVSDGLIGSLAATANAT